MVQARQGHNVRRLHIMHLYIFLHTCALLQVMPFVVLVFLVSLCNNTLQEDVVPASSYEMLAKKSVITTAFATTF